MPLWGGNRDISCEPIGRFSPNLQNTNTKQPVPTLDLCLTLLKYNGQLIMSFRRDPHGVAAGAAGQEPRRPAGRPTSWSPTPSVPSTYTPGTHLPAPALPPLTASFTLPPPPQWIPVPALPHGASELHHTAAAPQFSPVVIGQQTPALHSLSLGATPRTDFCAPLQYSILGQQLLFPGFAGQHHEGSHLATAPCHTVTRFPPGPSPAPPKVITTSQSKHKESTLYDLGQNRWQLCVTDLTTGEESWLFVPTGGPRCLPQEVDMSDLPDEVLNLFARVLPGDPRPGRGKPKDDREVGTFLAHACTLSYLYARNADNCLVPPTLQSTYNKVVLEMIRLNLHLANREGRQLICAAATEYLNHFPETRSRRLRAQDRRIITQSKTRHSGSVSSPATPMSFLSPSPMFPPSELVGSTPHQHHNTAHYNPTPSQPSVASNSHDNASTGGSAEISSVNVEISPEGVNSDRSVTVVSPGPSGSFSSLGMPTGDTFASGSSQFTSAVWPYPAFMASYAPNQYRIPERSMFPTMYSPPPMQPAGSFDFVGATNVVNSNNDATYATSAASGSTDITVRGFPLSGFNSYAGAPPTVTPGPRYNFNATWPDPSGSYGRMSN